MTFELKIDTKPLGDKMPGILMYGDYVTKGVHAAISTVMMDNWVDSPAYKARNKAIAFFQGGSLDSDGRYIFIELIKGNDPEACRDFMEVLNNAVRPFIGSELTKIKIAPNTEGAYYFISEISKETGCPYDPGTSMTPVTFIPEDTVQWMKVYKLCQYMGLTVINHKLNQTS